MHNRPGRCGLPTFLVDTVSEPSDSPTIDPLSPAGPFPAAEGPLVLPHRPRRGERFVLHINGVAESGHGEARGKVMAGSPPTLQTLVFEQRRTVPGDQVLVEVGGCHRGEVTARTLEISTWAPSRQTPRCPHFGPDPTQGGGCGGCSLQSHSDEAQHAIKTARVARLLDGAGVRPTALAPLVQSVNPWEYRNKMEFSFGPGPMREDGSRGELSLGLYPLGRRHEVVPLTSCDLFAAWTGTLLGDTVAVMRRLNWESRDDRRESGVLRTLGVRRGCNTGQVMLELTTHHGADDADGAVLAEGVAAWAAAMGAWAARNNVGLTSLWWTRWVAGKGFRTRQDSTLLAGDPVIRETLTVPGAGTLTFNIHPRSFFQPNTQMAQVLYGLVVQSVARMLSGLDVSAPRATVLDLYCGTGTIGMCLASSVGQVVGVELVPEAVEDARANSERHGLANTAWYAGDAAVVLERLVADEALAPDVVVVDPPRAGLAPAALEQVHALPTRGLVYVSCNPATLARDLAWLQGRGWTVQSVTPVDQFAQTPHVECIATVTRATAS